MTSSRAIEVKDLTKSFKSKVALDKVSFAVNEGEMLALVGASGSGKSTLLRNINGLQIADKGSIKIFDRPIQDNGKSYSQIRDIRSQIGFVFQQFNLVSRLSVLDNVLIGNLARVSLSRSLFRKFSKQEKEQALSALERVGILEQAYQRASTLSGGQQQRVAIARCLVQQARIILADEPIASLDPESARKVMELLTQLNREGITVVTTLHQVAMVRAYFPRAIALWQGKIMFNGKVKDLDNTRLTSIYGSAAAELILPEPDHSSVADNLLVSIRARNPAP